MAAFAAAVEALEKALRQSVGLRVWLGSRRWCGDALGRDTELAVKDRAPIGESADEAVVFYLGVAKDPNASVPIHLPLAVSAAKPEPEAFELPVGSERFFVTEGERTETFARFLVDGFRDGLSIRTAGGDVLHFSGESIGAFRSHDPRGEDSSNVLVRVATSEGEVVFKSYKLLDIRNREPEILLRLHQGKFRHAPVYRGELALGEGPDRLVLGIATDRVDAPDAFTWFTAGWREELLGTPADFERTSLDTAAVLGEATAELHDALLDRHPGPFQAESFSQEDADAATKAALSNLSDSLRRLAALAKGPEPRLAELTAKSRALVFENRERIETALGGLQACAGTAKGVTHADLHLGQVLRTDRGDLFFIDFEGEPERAPGARSAKLPFLRDVATMGRSFAYVKHYAWREATGGDATAAWRFLHRQDWSPEEDTVARRLAAWEAAAVERYTRTYLTRAEPYASVEPDQAMRAIRGWTMEKALYELRYELKHRPQNIFIPVEGLLSLARTPS